MNKNEENIKNCLMGMFKKHMLIHKLNVIMTRHLHFLCHSDAGWEANNQSQSKTTYFVYFGYDLFGQVTR